jgi:hypothetical protein
MIFPRSGLAAVVVVVVATYNIALSKANIWQYDNESTSYTYMWL